MSRIVLDWEVSKSTLSLFCAVVVQMDRWRAWFTVRDRTDLWDVRGLERECRSHLLVMEYCYLFSVARCHSTNKCRVGVRKYNVSLAFV